MSEQDITKLISHISILLHNDSLQMDNLVQTVVSLMRYIEYEFSHLKGLEKKYLLIESISRHINSHNSPSTDSFFEIVLDNLIPHLVDSVVHVDKGKSAIHLECKCPCFPCFKRKRIGRKLKRKI